MAKRTTFYVMADLFTVPLSPMAKLVLVYLSRCCNRQGICNPSIGTIAYSCNCCRNTVRKAIHEPEQAGMITVTSEYAPTKRGKRRRQPNTYTLHCPTSPYALPPVQQMPGAGSQAEQEINDNSNTIIAVPSVGITGDDGNDLEEILEKLHLDIFEDQPFSRSIEQAIRHMYRARQITVKKEPIPQGAVRDRLRLLTIDHIDYIEAQLGNRYDPVTCGENYLISCLYNAPMDCMVNSHRAC